MRAFLPLSLLLLTACVVPPNQEPPECTPASVDLESVRVVPFFFGAPQVALGASVDLDVATLGQPPGFTVVSVCEQWSLEPAGQGVTIDVDGIVTADADATPGVYTAAASFEGEEQTAEVAVYDPEALPFVGTWTEVAQLDCADDSEQEPEQPMIELIFTGGGAFFATWLPFEIRTDYSGTYALDGAGMTLDVEGGNYIPDDVDGTGAFELDGGRLFLRDLWLGTPPDGAAPARCGHVFE